jgi:uracil-DNA glycosylase
VNTRVNIVDAVGNSANKRVTDVLGSSVDNCELWLSKEIVQISMNVVDVLGNTAH